ncbi:MAG: Dihydrofolate reductase homolog, partial [uncultured Rubrobacteraceae bacterium]
AETGRHRVYVAGRRRGGPGPDLALLERRDRGVQGRGDRGQRRLAPWARYLRGVRGGLAAQDRGGRGGLLQQRAQARGLRHPRRAPGVEQLDAHQGRSRRGDPQPQAPGRRGHHGPRQRRARAIAHAKRPRGPLPAPRLPAGRGRRQAPVRKGHPRDVEARGIAVVRLGRRGARLRTGPPI